MTIPLGVQCEMNDALCDAKDIIDERGNEITIRVANEGDITRGKYGSIKKRVPTEYTMHAYPIKYNPTRDELEKAGIKENVDVIITLAMKDLTSNGLTYETIDHIRNEVAINIDPVGTTNSELYTIKDKNLVNMFSHTYLNVNLGLFRKA